MKGFQIQQKGERRISAALRIMLVVVLLAVQIGFVVAISYFMQEYLALAYGVVQVGALFLAVHIYNEPGELSYKLSNKKELDSDGLKDLEKSYKESYHKNVTIKKAVTMTAKLTETTDSGELSASREITVVKIENNWYIFGKVIEKFDLSQKG